MATNDVWWSCNDDDDDLQKALRASLAEMEGSTESGGTNTGADEDMHGMLPTEVTASFQKVVGVWERQKRIFWVSVDEALTHARAHSEHPQATVFVSQMVPEIVSICVQVRLHCWMSTRCVFDGPLVSVLTLRCWAWRLEQECTWADIVEDATTKDDYSNTFTRILEACLQLILESIR